MKRRPGMIKNGISWKGKLLTLVVALTLATAIILFPACSGNTYAQAIKISVETLNISGLHIKIEYYQDNELVNSIHFIDGDGDSVIDGKSGPSEESQWPKGWEWFNDMYNSVIVGHSTITVEGEKIKVQNNTTYELLTGKYECEQIG